jgi:asparagine synthase (glutamine-hydrolysing)
MCGIAGMVHVDPAASIDTDSLERMCRSLAHRGPDDSGVWTGEGVGLGHRRLSIIDLSPAGRQPMSNEDGSVWVVFNGEIYNFPELRRGLEERGHAFRSRTDSEVIVHLYEELGEKCVERLEGMFALALWDTKRRRLVLARDRVGKKPLKYAETADGLVFASELKAILAADAVPRDVDTRDVHTFLGIGYVPAPGTGFEKIRKLPAGHRLVWENGKSTLERYWSLDFRDKQTLSDEEWKERVRDTVRRAVKKRLISDVPLGVFLSGGIDSSIVAACMAQVTSEPIQTFSMGFEFDRYNELPYAKQVAEMYGTEHREFVTRADAAELLPTLAALYEEPYCDPSAVPSYLLSRETRKHVKVVLNGDGGDEGFAGYTRYERIASWAQRLQVAGRLGLDKMAKGAADLLAGPYPDLSMKLEAIQNLAARDAGVWYAWIVRLFSSRQKARLYNAETLQELGRNGEGPIPPLLRDPRGGESLIDRMLFADTMCYLPEDLLPKMDLASMAWGLEARSPLLDHEVLELAASAPADVKYRAGNLKWLLKESFRDELPEGILDREKQGFGIPLDEWLRGPLLPLARDLLTAAESRIHRYMQPRRVADLVERHAAGARDYGRQLWALLMLELWHREVVEAPVGRA